MLRENVVAELSAHGGAITLSTISERDLLLVRPRGYIGLTLLRREVRWAADFGRRHPNGWTYMIDADGVRLVNPANVFALRRIKQLPNIKAYVVISSSRIMRLAAATSPTSRRR